MSVDIYLSREPRCESPMSSRIGMVEAITSGAERIIVTGETS